MPVKVSLIIVMLFFLGIVLLQYISLIGFTVFDFSSEKVGSIVFLLKALLMNYIFLFSIKLIIAKTDLGLPSISFETPMYYLIALTHVFAVILLLVLLIVIFF